MSFEYDLTKSAANAAKHGIDFDQAQQLWHDLDRLEIPARMQGEPRFLVVGQIQGKHWSVIITYRQEAIRLISARRSRPEDITLYEN